MIKISTLFALIVMIFFQVAFLIKAGAAEGEDKNCTYSKEYITALEFLRSKKTFEVPENDARDYAYKISRGCNGAAQRFIKISSLLAKSGMASIDSIKLGLEFASRSDAEVQTFSAVYMRTFLEDYLNLDARTSAKIAKSLTSDFPGDITHVRQDFEKLSDFCMKTDSFEVPKVQCAQFAAKITRKSNRFKKGIAEAFFNTYSFLQSEKKGPNLTTKEALELADKLMDGGPETADNFITAFKYSMSPSGLAETIPNSLRFASQMSALPSDSK